MGADGGYLSLDSFHFSLAVRCPAGELNEK
jgi:hypothetical protein